jgi:hypothetical protein
MLFAVVEVAMDMHPVDEAIERYVQERMVKGAKVATARFLSYVHLHYQGKELAEFLRKTSGLVRYYIDFFLVMINPLKGPELAFFASAVSMAVFGGLMMADPEETNLGIVLISGAVVNVWAIGRNVVKKWCDLSVLIAIYREILALTEQELRAEAIPTD